MLQNEENVAPDSNLTLKELNIIRMISEGKSYKQVAGSMDVSPRTVEWHISNVLKKTKCHNKIEVIRFAEKQGIINNTKKVSKLKELNNFLNDNIALIVMITLTINAVCIAMVLRMFAMFHGS